jgi:uncharacterized protein (DUF1810 family)
VSTGDAGGVAAADPYDLERFVSAQDRGGTFEQALSELRAGRKTSHWMWFVFPQVAGLGQSPLSRTYAISGLAEAKAYLKHPVLGGRLRQAAGVVLAVPDSSAEQVFGGIDAQKLRSSMTLFLRASPGDDVFRQVLDRYFAGTADPATDQRL